MAKLTLQEQFSEALIARNEKQVQGRSSKYKTFTRKEGGFYYLGNAGSVRFGHCKSMSIPVSVKFKAALLGYAGTI